MVFVEYMNVFAILARVDPGAFIAKSRERLPVLLLFLDAPRFCVRIAVVRLLESVCSRIPDAIVEDAEIWKCIASFAFSPSGELRRASLSCLAALLETGSVFVLEILASEDGSFIADLIESCDVLSLLDYHVIGRILVRCLGAYVANHAHFPVSCFSRLALKMIGMKDPALIRVFLKALVLVQSSLMEKCGGEGPRLLGDFHGSLIRQDGFQVIEKSCIDDWTGDADTQSAARRFLDDLLGSV